MQKETGKQLVDELALAAELKDVPAAARSARAAYGEVASLASDPILASALYQSLTSVKEEHQFNAGF